jgi:branched-chain amino acid transport system permease protein
MNKFLESGWKKWGMVVSILCVWGLILAYPLFSGSYYGHIMILVYLNVTLAMGYRLLYVTGLGSFCHVTFYGTGGYASGLIALKTGAPFGICFLTGGVLSALIAILVGWPAVRAKGPYFFLISFSFFAVMDSVFKHWKTVTGGPGGLVGIPPIMGFTSVLPYYYISLAFCVVTVFIMYRIDKSRYGAELMAIGDDEELAESVGINVIGHRVLAFGIGALFAGFAGSIYAHYLSFIAPSSFSMWVTVYILIWCVFGGAKKVWGPIAGAVLLTLAAELLRMSGSIQALLYAAVLLSVIMAMPNGIPDFINGLRTKLDTAQERRSQE